MDRQGSELQALALLRQGRSDEDVERLTDVSLIKIIELRAKLAVAALPLGKALPPR